MDGRALLFPRGPRAERLATVSVTKTEGKVTVRTDPAEHNSCHNHTCSSLHKKKIISLGGGGRGIGRKSHHATPMTKQKRQS